MINTKERQLQSSFVKHIIMLARVAILASSGRTASRVEITSRTLGSFKRPNEPSLFVNRFTAKTSCSRAFSTTSSSASDQFNGAGMDGTLTNTSTSSLLDSAEMKTWSDNGEIIQQVVEKLADPPISSLGFGPTDTIIRTIQAIHEYGGLPWWASIVTMTILVRSAILPLTIMSQKNTANLVKASPELEQFKADVRLNPPKTVEDQMKNSMRLKEIYTKYDISMKKTLAPLLVQMPLFITFFLGLRRLAETYPTMKEGGILWFTDLSVADPTYALPLIAAGTFLLTIEMGGEVQSPQMDQKMMKNIMRGLGVAMVPMTMTFESGIFVYWVTTNLYSAAQIGTLKQPAVKKYLGLPQTLKPPPTSANIMKPTSFFDQLDKMTRPVNTVETLTSPSPPPMTPATTKVSASSETKINEQFVSEMKEARSRRSRRRQ